jgi:hypothetical protein
MSQDDHPCNPSTTWQSNDQGTRGLLVERILVTPPIPGHTPLTYTKGRGRPHHLPLGPVLGVGTGVGGLDPLNKELLEFGTLV